MTRRPRLSLATGAALMLATGLAFAAPPRNVNPHKHPHLADAQRLTHQAWEQTVAAQKANEWDMNGHAQKAKELLDAASEQLKLAAEAANHN